MVIADGVPQLLHPDDAQLTFMSHGQNPGPLSSGYDCAMALGHTVVVPADDLVLKAVERGQAVWKAGGWGS